MKVTSRTISLAAFVVLLLLGITSSLVRARPAGDGTLRITVRDPSGAAVAGATVSARRKPCRCEDCPLDQRPCRCCIQQVTTDDGGQATFTVASGSYDVKVDVSGFKTFEQDGVEVHEGETRTVEISLNPGSLEGVVQVTHPASTATAPKKNYVSEFVFSGRIQNENNQPLPNVEILFAKRGCKCDSCSEKEKPCKCCLPQRAMSDASGNFSVTGLKPSDDYAVRLVKDGQNAGTFNGLEVRKSEKVLFTVVEPNSPKQ